MPDYGKFFLLCSQTLYTISMLSLIHIFSLAKNFRAKGKCVGMYKRETGEQKEHFMQYAKRQNVVSMLYLRDDLKIEMINLKTGDEKTVDAAKKPD